MLLIFLYVAAGSISVYYIYSYFSAKTPKLYGNPESDYYALALKEFSFLSEPYRPPWWAQNGIIMTVARSFQSIPSLPWTRELLEFPDGGVTALDWLHPEGASDDCPILVLLPGVIGHTYDGSYLYNPAKDAFQKGFRVLILNRRGLGVPLKTPKMYCSDNSDDTTFILETVQTRYPCAKKIGCGFSLGGMILLNYLAKRNKEDSIIDLGMSVSAPFSNGDAAKRMMHFVPRLTVSPALMKSLIEAVVPHKEVLENHIDYPKLKKAKSLREFDNILTAPLAGFNDEEHYYTVTQLHSKIHDVPVPFLVLTAEDDFLVHLEDVPLAKITETKNVLCLTTKHGGHTAFMEKSNINASGFAEKVLFKWIDMHVNK